MKTVRFLFNDAMARAIVDGRKAVTRRPVMPQPTPPAGWYPDRYAQEQNWTFWGPRGSADAGRCSPLFRAPCLPGDLLIGRECWGWASWYDGANREGVEYRADGARVAMDRGDDPNIRAGWRPSIHMPDWAARIRRRVVSVTVERLHDISEADAVREGFASIASPAGHPTRPISARDMFGAAWNGIYATKGLAWPVNPWVWRIEFSPENVSDPTR